MYRILFLYREKIHVFICLFFFYLISGVCNIVFVFLMWLLENIVEIQNEFIFNPNMFAFDDG